jgi:hypothetical protein
MMQQQQQQQRQQQQQVPGAPAPSSVPSTAQPTAAGQNAVEFATPTRTSEAVDQDVFADADDDDDIDFSPILNRKTN